MEWPPDFYAQLAGETCPLCAQGRPAETPHGLRYLTGEAADAYLVRADLLGDGAIRVGDAVSG